MITPKSVTVYFGLSDWNYFTFPHCLALLSLRFVLGSQASFLQPPRATLHFKKDTESLDRIGN